METKLLTSDNELVARFLEGDPEGFDHLLERYRQRVFSYILLNVRKRDLAEDIFQDTFIKVFRSLQEGRYRDDGKFAPWVLRIAHNLIIDHFRRENQMPTISRDNYNSDILDDRQFTEKAQEDRLIEKQIGQDIRLLLDELPADQKEVVLLRHYLGMSFKEIADHTQVSINTALGRMRYAVLNLRKLVEERNIVVSI